MIYNKIKKSKRKNKITFEMFILLALVTSLAFNSLPTVSAKAPEDVFNEEFDETIESFFKHEQGSAALAFFYQNDFVYTKGYGAKPALDTVYLIGALSQIFTAIAVMQLYEEGLLNIVDEINDYLPYELNNSARPEVPITIKHLLTHTSTIEDTPEYYDFIENATFKFEDIPYALLHESGSEYGDSWNLGATPGLVDIYTDLGNDLLAYIVQLITAQDFEDYVTAEILTPLGMTNTKLNYTDYNEAKLATHVTVAGANTVIHPHKNYDGRGSLGWRSTIEDLSKLALIFMNESHDGVSILNQTSIDLMLTDYGDDYGFGFYLNRFLPPSGGIGGTFAVMDSVFKGSYHFLYFNGTYGWINLWSEFWNYPGADVDAETCLKFSKNSLLSLVEPDKTSFSFVAIPSVLAIIGTLLVLQRRRK